MASTIEVKVGNHQFIVIVILCSRYWQLVDKTHPISSMMLIGQQVDIRVYPSSHCNYRLTDLSWVKLDGINWLDWYLKGLCCLLLGSIFELFSLL